MPVSPENKLAILRPVSPFHFAPLVNTPWRMAASLDILFLRQEPAGHLITQGGDLDNRMKTLLDALRMPLNKSELPDDDTPLQGEDPFYCLLEDDALVTGISITADHLLMDLQHPSDVLLIIQARPQFLDAGVTPIRWI